MLFRLAPALHAPSPMRPLSFFACSALLGTYLYPALQPDCAPCLCGILALLLLALCWPKPWILRTTMSAAGLLLGLAIPARLPTPPALQGDWKLAGEVITPARGSEADLALSAGAPLSGDWIPLKGRVRVHFSDPPPPPGSQIRLMGKITGIDPTYLPGAPDPVWSASRARVASRVQARDVLVLGPPPPQFDLSGTQNEGFMRSMLDGNREGISAELSLLLRRTGTSHLLSISGLHIGLAAALGGGLGWLLFRPLLLVWRGGELRWGMALGAIAGALAYADLAGWPLPAVRAAAMTTLAALCHAIGLRPAAGPVLSVALLVALFTDPDAISAPSFLLSFSALWGMMWIGPRITRLIPLDAPLWLQWLGQGLSASIGATAGTFPVTTYYFQAFPPLSLLANLWAVPWIGSIATPALLLSQALPSFIGRFCLALADAACSIGLWGLQWVDRPPWVLATGWQGAIILSFLLLLRRREMVALLLATLIFAFRTVPNHLTLYYFSIGQGDAALVRWPDGRDWLIDGGPPGRALLETLRRMGIRKLDTVFLSHPHPDHYGGLLPIAEALPIDRLWVGRLPKENEVDFQNLIALTGPPQVGLHSTDPNLELLHPALDFHGPRDPVNDESLVVRIHYGQHRFLFLGDVEAAGEAALVAQGDLAADVMKVPHHGSRTSSSEALIAAIHPQIAVISCGWQNRFRHPSPEVLGRYQNTQLYRTDLQGSIVIHSDGQSLQVTQEGQPDIWRLQSYTPIIPLSPSAQPAPSGF